MLDEVAYREASDAVNKLRDRLPAQFAVAGKDDLR